MRWERKVNDADHITVTNAALMTLQSIERASKQTGVNPGVNGACQPGSERRSCGTGSKASQSKIDQKTARNDQDGKLHSN
jgi:hypothetical protein